MKEKVREEYLLHATVAVTLDRGNMGVLEAKLWQRPEQPVISFAKAEGISAGGTVFLQFHTRGNFQSVRIPGLMQAESTHPQALNT